MAQTSANNTGGDDPVASLSPEEYARIERLLTQTRRGRAFLIAHSRQNGVPIGSPEANSRIAAAITQIRQVIGVLEQAASNIMATAERVQDEAPDRVNDKILEIITQCSFQDETGQRLNRLARELERIDEELRALGVELGQPAARDNQDGPSASGPRDDGIDQDEIDKIMGN